MDQAWAGPSAPSLRTAIALLVVLALAFPINLSLGDVDIAAGAGQGIAVAAVFLILPAQFLLDTGRPRPGSLMRLAVLFMVLTSLVSWTVVAIQRGTSLGAVLSLLNWIALGGIAVLGQVLTVDGRRLDLMLRAWTAVQVSVAGGAILYLLALFGPTLFTASSRGPFQLAMHAIIEQWPNGTGLSLSVGAVLCFALNRGRWRLGWPVIQLTLLVLGVMVTFSRNALLAMVAGMVAVTVLRSDIRRGLFAAVILLVVLSLTAMVIPPVRSQIVATWSPGSSQQLSIIERLAFALEAIRVWRQNPVVGIGFGRFDEFASLDRLSGGTSIASGYVPGSVHNEYLSTLLKGGIISAFSFAVILILIWRLFLRSARHSDPASPLRRWGAAGIGVTTVLCVGGMGGETFRHIGISGPFWILAGGLSMLQSPNRQSASGGTGSDHVKR